MRIVTPIFSNLSISISISSTIIGANPSEGSSNNNIYGLPARVLAMDNICCSPPDN